MEKIKTFVENIKQSESKVVTLRLIAAWVMLLIVLYYFLNSDFLQAPGSIYSNF